MQIDVTNQKAPHHIDVDLCIVGGGPAGICIAHEYARTGRAVAVLEAGRLDIDPETHLLNIGWSQGAIADRHPLYLAASRRRVFGGSQVLWGGWCTPLTEMDFAYRDWVPDSGWPIPFSEMFPHYERAARVCGLHVSAAQHQPERSFMGGDLIERLYHFVPGRRTMRDIFGDALTKAENVHLYLGASVTAFDLDATGTRIREISFRSLSGEASTVSANTFVLAAGGIENARLLLANRVSGESDLTGRCFMEHPHVAIGCVRLPGKALWSRFLERMHPDLGHTAMFALAVPAETQRRLGLLNGAVQLWPDREIGGEADHGEFRATLVLRTEQRPNQRSRVELSEDCDVLGVPLSRLCWELDPEDWRSVCETARIVADALTKHAGAHVQLEISEDSPWPDLPSHLDHCNPWGCHHMGTTRMSADPRLGVVDTDLKVHGMRNLFVAGSSVFPTGGYANPTFTVIALALRTASRLATLT